MWGGTGALSSSEVPLVNTEWKPDQVNPTALEPFPLQCSYCDGDVPKCISKHCVDCDLHFHPGHYQLHRGEWPCPLIDYDLCPWCAQHIEDTDDVMECDVCQYTMHSRCYAEHMPCPDGWNKLEKSADGNTEKEPPLPEPSAPVTPPTQSTLQATNLAQQFLAQMEAIHRGEQPQQLFNSYPTSRCKTG